MVGREVMFQVTKSQAQPGNEVLTLSGVHCKDVRGLPALKDISLTVRAGEIVGIAGVEGNGQKELVDSIIGLWPVEKGSILFEGRNITHSTVTERRKIGVSYIPEDRMTTGLCMPLSVKENILMGYHKQARLSWKKLVLKQKKVNDFVQSLIEEYDIRTPNMDTSALTLSGGNLQKVVLAREIASKPRLLIASQPTRGVDMGAIEYIHKELVAYRDEGCAILLISADLQEIMNLSDRIAVIYEGELVCNVPREGVDEHHLGLWMTGSFSEEEVQHGR
jgi:simple sugar transport system ATP-binding protein